MSIEPLSEVEPMIMWTDPVVEGIHQIRQKLLSDAGGHIEALVEKARAHQAAQGGVVIEIRLPPQKANGQD